MYRFSRAIVRKPGRSLVAGLTEADLGLPDYDRAVIQHQGYVDALRQCGLDVTVLEAREEYPDSVFIEDVAVLTADCAIITRPGAPTRAGEVAGMVEVLQPFYQKIERIEAPGTLEGGDVMQVGRHVFIGLSERTNRAGAEQLIAILKRYGLTGTTVPVAEFLHLKTGVTSFAEGCFVAAGELVESASFSGASVTAVAAGEEPAANCIRINDRVLVPAGYDRTRSLIEAAGVETIAVEISEFTKLDGGLTCLSLRF